MKDDTDESTELRRYTLVGLLPPCGPGLEQQATGREMGGLHLPHAMEPSV